LGLDGGDLHGSSGWMTFLSKALLNLATEKFSVGTRPNKVDRFIIGLVNQ
jgi:hypothetical protein